MPIRFRSRSLVLRAIVATLLLLPSASHAEPNPFAQLAGAWRGSGTLSPLGAQSERMLCRVNYKVSGNTAHQTLDCAGTDYRILVNSDLKFDGETLSGNWTEQSFGVSGVVGGIAKGDTIYVRITSESFNGRMTIKTAAGSQSVDITQFDAGSGRYSQLASVTLRR